MDPGEELAGAGGFPACSLPRAHASRSFSAGGAPSACLTPLMLLSLAAPLLITAESCVWVPPAMGVSHHPWRMLCRARPPRCFPAGNAHLPPDCAVSYVLTPTKHTPSLLHHASGAGHQLRTGFLTHLRVTRLPEHSRSPPPGEESHRQPFLGTWAAPGSVLGEGDPPSQAARDAGLAWDVAPSLLKPRSPRWTGTSWAP